MKNNDWKERLNVVYSTNPDYSYEMEDEEAQITPAASQQKLRFEVIHKPHLVCREVLLGHAAVLLVELSQSEQIGKLRVFGQICLVQICLKCVNHIERPPSDIIITEYTI